MAYASKEQAQVFVDFGRGAYGTAGIARNDLLLDGDGGRNAANEVALGLVHAPKELSRIAGQTLHIAALTLGIERVECQRRLTRARDAGDDDEFIAGYAHVNILEVVDARSLDFYV